MDNVRMDNASGFLKKSKVTKDVKKFMLHKTNKILYNIPYNPETNPQKIFYF